MNNIIKKISGLILLAILFSSCKKEEGPLTDIKPVIPVTVTNAMAWRPDPTVSASLSGGGAITITLSIPASSGRTIKEITKVATSTNYSQIQSTGTAGFYTAAPIAVNATSYTFNTSITEYFVKNPVSASNPAATANAELARRFYFLITLDDGSVIVTEPVRILVLA